MLALKIAEALEQGGFSAPWGAPLAGVWRRTIGSRIAREVAWPPGVRVVAVGGATLGGSGKTPLAIACAIELEKAGASTAVVGHGYRGELERACIVAPGDRVERVGDEAIVAARALAGCRGARVVVGPTRAAAVALAARDAEVLVLDGVGQTNPIPAALALLAVDGEQPWGRAAALPPYGDLRAPVPALLAACDAVVPLTDGEGGPAVELRGAPAVLPARVESGGAWWSEPGPWTGHRSFVSWDTLRSARVGVVAALARPDRVVRALVRRGVYPCAIVRAADHGPFGVRSVRACRALAGGAIDVWVATRKCALHAAGASLGAPLAVLDHSLTLHPALCARLQSLAMPAVPVSRAPAS